MSGYNKKRSKSTNQTTVFRQKTISQQQFKHQYIVKRRWLIGLLVISLALTIVFIVLSFCFNQSHLPLKQHYLIAFGTLFGIFLATDFGLTFGLAYLDARKSYSKPVDR